jgi:hypothetical protein
MHGLNLHQSSIDAPTTCPECRKVLELIYHLNIIIGSGIGRRKKHTQSQTHMTNYQQAQALAMMNNISSYRGEQRMYAHINDALTMAAQMAGKKNTHESAVTTIAAAAASANTLTLLVSASVSNANAAQQRMSAQSLHTLATAAEQDSTGNSTSNDTSNQNNVTVIDLTGDIVIDLTGDNDMTCTCIK